MKPAPIQLLQVIFRRVSVEWDERYAPAEPPNPFTTVFTFDGVDISTEFSIGALDAEDERGRMFGIGLRVLVDNAEAVDDPDRKFSPYLIDVEARGMVLVPNGAEMLAPAQELAAVNGASLLWSAIREQILSVSSRMLAGPVMLPTVHFHDLKQNEEPLEEAPQELAAKSKRTRSRKAASGKAD